MFKAFSFENVFTHQASHSPLNTPDQAVLHCQPVKLRPDQWGPRSFRIDEGAQPRSRLAVPGGGGGQMRYFLLSIFFPLYQISGLYALGIPSHSQLGEVQRSLRTFVPEPSSPEPTGCFLALPLRAQPSPCHMSLLRHQPPLAHPHPDAST